MGRRGYWAQVMLLSLALLPVAIWVYFHLAATIGMVVMGALVYYGGRALYRSLDAEWAANNPIAFRRFPGQPEPPNPVQKSPEELRLEQRFREIVQREDWDKPGR